MPRLNRNLLRMFLFQEVGEVTYLSEKFKMICRMIVGECRSTVGRHYEVSDPREKYVKKNEWAFGLVLQSSPISVKIVLRLRDKAAE
jgi:hypothetical protein